MKQPHDWDRVRGLHDSLEQNEALELSVDVLDLCRRVARELALRDEETEHALLTPPGMETLVRQLRRRISEGSRRLSRALIEAEHHKRAGDVAGARQVLERVLAVEPVPFYRQQAMAALAYVDESED